jgi:predicted transposase/invertase (TIGR01784 family)
VKTDTIFYRLFQEFPHIFFELIGQPELPADTYQFTSVELKQLAFRLDGLFLPPPNQPNLPMYFVEVQFQKDQGFYYRLFAEIFLYIYQYKPTNNWRAVVVYPRRGIESVQPVQYQLLLNSNQVQVIYLDD